jgi:PAS domain S-box-containing protein
MSPASQTDEAREAAPYSQPALPARGDGGPDALRALIESEASYKAALQAGNMGSWETDFRKSVRHWSQEGMALFGIALPDGKGQVGGEGDEWMAAVHPDDRDLALAIRQQADALDSFTAEYRIRRPTGAVVWLSGRGRVVERDGLGKPLRLVSIMADITDRKQSEEALRESEARFRAIFENVAVGIAYTDLDGGWIDVNQRLCDILGRSRADLLRSEPDALLHPDERGRERSEMARLRAGEIGHSAFDIRYRLPDGGDIWVGRTVSLLLDRDGAPLHFISVYRDVSQRKQAQDHQRFLLAELSHRSKNLLAVIQGIAGQTIRSVDSLDAFKTSFMQRLQGIAATQDILVRQDWAGGDLKTLVGLQLDLFGGVGDERILIDGPPILLTADAVQAIGLALHELATNAVKYGALSSPAGRVEVRWSLCPGAGDLQMDWTESGGPRVTPPARTGFGSVVLDKMVAATVAGVVTLDYARAGLRWRLVMPARNFSLPRA